MADGDPHGRLPELVLYSGRGCHLCSQARQILEQVCQRVPFQFREIRIDDVPELEKLYRLELPVVTVEGRKLFKYKVDPAKLERRLRRLAEKPTR